MQKAMCMAPMYPDIYYKIQPHVMAAIDQMDLQGCMMPEQEEMKGMCDSIYGNVMKTYPELFQMDFSLEAVRAASPNNFDNYGQPYGGGFLNDLVYILFLNELFRRRRRY